MPKLDISKAELVWPGKYDEEGNRIINRGVALPFQVVETIREGRATREPGNTADLFSYAKPPSGGESWKNKLIWGDNLLVMESLLDEFAGKLDLIYIDPPFAIGADFSITTEIGEAGIDVGKAPSAVEEKAYRDTWSGGLPTYLAMIADRVRLMHNLLAPTGSFYIHLDATVGHYVKVICDEIFGRDSFQREIIWRIGWVSGYKSAAKNWIRNHDTILFYVKTPGEFKFNKRYVPYPAGYERRGGEGGGKGYPIEDVWNANPSEFQLKGEDSLDSIQIKSFSAEKTGYSTQKNVSLLRRIIDASTDEGDLVGDFFLGSGTTAVAAEKLGRQWIGCDLGRFAIHTTRKRLLDIPDCKPFEILNLGQYERKYWQGTSFGDQKPAEPDAVAIAAYVRFILDLYSAQAVSGVHIHGRRGGAMVHVGAVDAPVTIREVNDAVAECATMHQKELHVLGWEWEMGLHDPLAQAALRDHAVRLRLLNIPREVMEKRAVEAGDIRFFDLAHLEAELEQDAKHPRKVKVKLRNFVIPDTDLIPDEVRDKIRKWSDYVDYWAVDWNFKHDTFMNAWQTYRTRQNRKLALVSDVHEYKAAGRYQVLIKVVDIFGNDTSRLLDCKVK